MSTKSDMLNKTWTLMPELDDDDPPPATNTTKILDNLEGSEKDDQLSDLLTNSMNSHNNLNSTKNIVKSPSSLSFQTTYFKAYYDIENFFIKYNYLLNQTDLTQDNYSDVLLL